MRERRASSHAPRRNGDSAARPPFRWVLTDHAVARYIERIDPTATRASVRDHVFVVSRRAHLVGTRDGCNLYRDPEQPMRAEYIVAPDGGVLTVTDPTVQTADYRREAAR